MKCPVCGQWNRASFPVCQNCGAPLTGGEAASPSWRSSLRDDQKGNQYIRVDSEGEAQDTPDTRDSLAKEMSELKVRKAQGRQYQRQLRADAARRGSAPSSMTVRTRTEGDRFWEMNDDPASTVRAVPHRRRQQAEGRKPDDYTGSTNRVHTVSETETAERSFNTLYEQNEFSTTWSLPPVQPSGKLTARIPSRRKGLRKFVTFLAIVLVTALAALGAYTGYNMITDYQEAKKAQNAATVIASMKNDLAAHTILIPGEDGQQIYIRELHTTYVVTDGYATIEVEDHTWYDDYEDFLDATMEITLTPFLKTASGTQKPLDPITYEIEIPLSPIELDSPDDYWVEVSSSMYTMSFTVRPGSKVTINGVDCSDTVDSEDGTLSYNATVQPIGDNVFTVIVRSQYCRENTMTVTLYRETQEIPLDLAADTYTSTSSSTMTVNCTTLPGAYVEVLTNHRDLDVTNVDTSGEFSFTAVFDHIGNNTITITAAMTGKKTSTVNYTVYYVPPASEYTPKAWPLTSSGYSELLSNLTVRAANTQVYLVTGVVAETVSDKPQMCVFYTGTDDQGNPSQPVLVENKSKTTWVEGTHYEIYADAYSSYNNMPWLIARYTYAR